MSPATCSGPECAEPAYATGLCTAHYRQKRRHPRRPLQPLRRRPGAGGVPVKLNVSRATAEAVRADFDGAREALERWARRDS